MGMGLRFEQDSHWDYRICNVPVSNGHVQFMSLNMQDESSPHFTSSPVHVLPNAIQRVKVSHMSGIMFYLKEELVEINFASLIISD